jgi:sensor histidine kinase YesM
MIANSIGKFIERFKILHILFWAYSFYALLHERIQFYGGTAAEHFPIVFIIKFFQAACVYFTTLFLVQRYLNRNKYLFFTAYMVSSVVAFGFITAVVLDLYFRHRDGIQPFSILFMAVSLVVDLFIVTMIFLAITIIMNRYRHDQRNRKVEKARLETELDFLKAQINPHFLFNAINSIYVLIDIDKQQARETLLKFSGMLRYQLYECNDDKIEINRELGFISDYIGIESLRKEDNLQVNFNHPEKYNYLKIPPFLLMPFVENAFKHVSKNNGTKNYISIDAEFADHTFRFCVTNTYDENPAAAGQRGIGLQNVRRRLELLFPDKHRLKIEKKDHIHSTTLTLDVS